LRREDLLRITSEAQLFSSDSFRSIGSTGISSSDKIPLLKKSFFFRRSIFFFRKFSSEDQTLSQENSWSEEESPFSSENSP